MKERMKSIAKGALHGMSPHASIAMRAASAAASAAHKRNKKTNHNRPFMGSSPKGTHAGAFSQAVHQGAKRAAGAAIQASHAGRKIMDLHNAMSYSSRAGMKVRK